MNLVGAVLACLACMLLWALAEALAELLGNATSKAAAPAWRPLWRMFVRARWPWPALVMTALGAGGVVAGDSIHERPDADWRGGAGVLLYFIVGRSSPLRRFSGATRAGSEPARRRRRLTVPHLDPPPNVR